MATMVDKAEVQINDVVEFAELRGDWVVTGADPAGAEFVIKPLGWTYGDANGPRLHATDRKIIVRVRDRKFFGNEDMIAARAMWWS